MAEGYGPRYRAILASFPPPMLVAVLLAFAVQCLCWAWVGVGLRRVREGAPWDEDDSEAPGSPDLGTEAGRVALPISVVVAAHDEAERLPALLDALAAQTHRDADDTPAFEVVVVDDRSADRTAGVVRWRMQDFPAPLRLVQVSEGEPEAAGLPPKKHALARGVEAATHERLAFTDADARPGPEWLATLARWATHDPVHLGAEAGGPGAADSGAVLVGYGPLTGTGALAAFARYETVQTAALAAAGIGWGRPWQAVGRNLSYPRSLLARLGGFEHSADSLSGDDDLLVQEVARTGAAPVRYVWDERAAVPSAAPETVGAFWRQKRRHASAGGHYPARVLAALGVFHVSNGALWLGAPLFHLATGLPYGWGLIAVKLLVQRSVLSAAFDALGDDPYVRLLQPALDAVSAAYHAAFAVLGLLPPPRRW